MLNNTLKQHLNQIDTSLKSTFGTVNFTHEDIYHSSIEVSDNSINEDLAPIRVKITIEHEKLNRDTSRVDWTYKIDPNNEDSVEIKRTSLIENIGNDVSDIVVNKRMDKEYIENCLISLINESSFHDNIVNKDRKVKFTGKEGNELTGTITDVFKQGYEITPDSEQVRVDSSGQRNISSVFLRDFNEVEFIGEDKSPEQEEAKEMVDELEEAEKDEFQIGESIVFTDYQYNEQRGTIEKKISLTILDKEYKGWIVKTENGEEKQVMDYDIQKDSREPKWWNN